MNKWGIVCDSSCDITKLDNLAENCVFSIAPLKISFGDTTFTDDENLDIKRLLEFMSSSKEASSSACPSVHDWLSLFEKSENVIAVTISDKLSGANNAAMVAKDMFCEKYPDRKIHVVNSLSTAGSMILLAQKANSLIKEDLSFEQVVEKLEEYNKTMRLVFCLKNYNTLIKNGRMSPLLGAVASVLGIRAIAVKSEVGDIKVVSKQRGDAGTYKYMTDLIMQKENVQNLPVYINHCDNIEGANAIKEILTDKYGCKDVRIVPTRGLCSFYANIGGIIVSY